jgi:hypothetical protein
MQDILIVLNIDIADLRNSFSIPGPERRKSQRQDPQKGEQRSDNKQRFHKNSVVLTAGFIDVRMETLTRLLHARNVPTDFGPALDPEQTGRVRICRLVLLTCFMYGLFARSAILTNIVRTSQSFRRSRGGHGVRRSAIQGFVGKYPLTSLM